MIDVFIVFVYGIVFSFLGVLFIFDSDGRKFSVMMLLSGLLALVISLQNIFSRKSEILNLKTYKQNSADVISYEDKTINLNEVFKKDFDDNSDIRVKFVDYTYSHFGIFYSEQSLTIVE